MTVDDIAIAFLALVMATGAVAAATLGVLLKRELVGPGDEA